MSGRSVDLGLLALVLKLRLSPLLQYDQRCCIASLVFDDGECCAAEHSPLFLFVLTSLSNPGWPQT